jgi:hypothetical protein
LVKARAWPCLLVLLGLGCDHTPPAEAPDPPPVRSGSRFDSSSAGTITGQVLWEGDLPAVPALKVLASPAPLPPLDHNHERENPSAPHIDPRSRGVAGAVVMLRGVDLDRARPWPHGPVRIEQRDCCIHVVQDGQDCRVGFVRPGDPVTLVSKERVFHALRASGAAFFTLMFPDPDEPLERRFAKKGHVELSSGAGYFWMRGHLFVDDNPYYARTDADGRFLLTDVPPGRYTLTCWHAHWVITKHEREPENALITRLFFRPPLVREQQVRVEPRGSATVRFTLSQGLFLP